MKFVVVGLLGLSVLAGGGYFYWTSTPEYSLSQIGESVKTKNKALFETHVDVKQVTDAMVDEAIGMANQEMSKSKNAFAAFGQMLATGVLNSMKPQFEMMVEKEINKLFEHERQIASNGNGKNPFKGLEESSKVLVVHDYQKRDCSDQVCYFSISFEHQLTHKRFELLAKMEKHNSSWKLTELVDFIKNLNNAKS